MKRRKKPSVPTSLRFSGAGPGLGIEGPAVKVPKEVPSAQEEELGRALLGRGYQDHTVGPANTRANGWRLWGAALAFIFAVGSFGCALWSSFTGFPAILERLVGLDSSLVPWVLFARGAFMVTVLVNTIFMVRVAERLARPVHVEERLEELKIEAKRASKSLDDDVAVRVSPRARGLVRMLAGIVNDIRGK